MQTHVAILFEYPSLNGGERSMLAAIDALHSRANDATQFSFTAIAPPNGPLADEFDCRGIRRVPFVMHEIDGTRKPNEDVKQDLIRVTEQIAPDILHANSLAMSRLTGSIATDVTCQVTGHLRDIMKVSKAAMADLNRNDQLAAVSHATRDFHIERGMDTERVQVVYNGVDTVAFRPRKSTGQLIGELQLPSNSFLILSVGQIGLRKGVDIIAQAAVTVCEQISNAHFVIVGERNSQKQESIDFENRLGSLMNEAGFGNRWHRLGRRTDVADLMNEADLLVHAAHQEPLGRVLLEAAASGLPIIATDVGGTREILMDGLSARLIPKGDPQALADAIVQMHSVKAFGLEFYKQARETIEAEFTVQHAANALARFWQP